jgi:SAM-dependent methyltransferase/GT2 family glycosyltransferase
MAERRPPAFSILCSAYQCEAYLAETIESVLAQTLPDWELIVVDNGPSDEIADIVRRYTADPRVRLVRQQNSRLIGGIAAAFEASCGRYIVPLDSDDMLAPGFCERMAEVLGSRAEIDVLSCDARVFRDGEHHDLAASFLRKRFGLEHRITLADMIGEHDVIPYFAAFRRAAWMAAGGYAAGTELVEDIALYLRLIVAGHDVRVLPERLARYRLRGDSTSRHPSGVEAFEAACERVYSAAAEESGDAATLALLDRRLRGFRYEQGLRRARWAFVNGDVAGARAASRAAFAARRNPRSTAVLVGVTVAPGALRLIRPLKQRFTRDISRVLARAAVHAELRLNGVGRMDSTFVLLRRPGMWRPRKRAERPRQYLTDREDELRLLSEHVAASRQESRPVRVLEAGCGQDWELRTDGVRLHITGVDTDAEAMRIRREQQGDLDVAVLADLRTVDLPRAAFDVVYCSFVLEHVAGAEAVLDRLVEATRPGGRIIVRVPDGDTVYGFFVRHSPHRVHVLYKRYVEGYADAGKPGHAPYPVVYDDVVSVRGLRAFARSRDLEVADEYGTNHVLEHFRQLGPAVDVVLRCIARLSRGRLLATHNNIGVVLRRPPCPAGTR